LAALAVGFILLYVLGVFVRNSRGIRVIVHNESGTNLKNAKVTLESGDSYLLGEIAVGKTKSIFVVPGTPSNIRLEFADPNGQQRSEIVAGYVENSYCGDVAVGVLSDFSVRSRDESFALVNWKSWYGFL
jgi:hypothetical protein